MNSLYVFSKSTLLPIQAVIEHLHHGNLAVFLQTPEDQHCKCVWTLSLLLMPYPCIMSHNCKHNYITLPLFHWVMLKDNQVLYKDGNTWHTLIWKEMIKPLGNPSFLFPIGLYMMGSTHYCIEKYIGYKFICTVPAKMKAYMHCLSVFLTLHNYIWMWFSILLIEGWG